MLIQFLEDLQSNTLLLTLPLRLSIVSLRLPLLNYNGSNHCCQNLLHRSSPLPPCSLGATYLFTNPVFHSRMKHLAIDYHFVRDLVQSFELCVVHVSTGDQLVDALTKSLSRSRLFDLCNKIGVISGTTF